MRALLIALLLVSCGGREIADAIKEAKATPTPEATATPTPEPAVIAQTEIVAPEPIVIVVVITPTPAPTPSPEQIELERNYRYNECQKSAFSSCGVSGSAAARCRARISCDHFKTMTVEKMGPFETWYISR